ncbi:unnamed protein product [Diatraea saccharalis]|uniref:Protein kintoun n=1 Tax=Diatraea saccharalis TaxID=40085 RepID=A0A9N9W5F7_9NEOP|nr:unnamed protein product [Diatraea saccharalis]
MATGVKPRDEESQLTRTDLEVIQEAMKNKKFRDLLVDYCEEVRDPANQALYQKEMTQLEKERGYDVTFINPKGGYVIKTSVAGDRKAFINICSNENIDKPSYKVQEVSGRKGMNWLLPYSIIPPREDYDHKKERCVIYDVVFHPDTLRMAEANKQFRDLVNKTACEGLQNTFNIHFDSNNLRFPKSHYKGMTMPAVIRKEDPNFQPPSEEDSEEVSPELLDKLYPQSSYTAEKNSQTEARQKCKLKTNVQSEFHHASDNGYTVPKYTIKQQKNVDFQDYTYNKDCKQYAAIPSHIVVEVNLPLLSSTKDCILDVHDKSLGLKSERPAKYKLNIVLPYSVNDESGIAKFDKNKRTLTVTLPVIKQHMNSDKMNSLKVDSGVESENSESQSDEDNADSKIIEISSTPVEYIKKTSDDHNKSTSTLSSFFSESLGYVLPAYTHNVLDEVIAFTFHVKNTEPDSVKVQRICNKVFIKFTTVGSGFVPVHYGAILKFDDCTTFDNVTGEAWDNNVILQLELASGMPQRFEIGLNEDSMVSEEFDTSQVSKNANHVTDEPKVNELEVSQPIVEVTNLGTETNIVVSSNQNDDIEDDLDEDDFESPTVKEKEIVWTEQGSDSGAKSILRKPMSMMRSFSESSADIASSMDYISSDCIHEENSLKKTVRFNDVIARQFYRYNSSIEGQKKKNQRKKSKKRSQDRRKSESEAEDDITNTNKSSKPRLKSVLKQRRDSGLADTSDAEADCKSSSMYSEPDDKVSDKNGNGDINGNNGTTDNIAFKSMLNIVDKNNQGQEPTIWKSDTETKKSHKKNPDSVTCDNIKHNTDLYNPDKLNKGQYLEITFKNDLIFDLDM